MNNKLMIKGKEVLYLPEITDKNGPQKAYFLFKTKSFYTSNQYARIIITSDKSIIDKYEDIDNFEAAQENNSSLTNDDKLIFLPNIEVISKYSDYRLGRAKNLYMFLLKYEKLYKCILKYLSLFSNDNETLFYSNYFTKLRKNFNFFRIRFWSRIILFSILGTLKFFLYPFIFVFDVIRSTYDTYFEYRKAKVKVGYYSSGNLKMKMAYLAIDEKEFQEQKKNYEVALKSKKYDYTTTNITVLTLILAVLGLSISLFTGWIDKKNSEDKLEQLQKEYNTVIDENRVLESKLDSQSKYLQQITFLNDIIVNKNIEIDKLQNSLQEATKIKK